MKGGSSAITADDLLDAMNAIAKSARRDGESTEQAFVRLLVDEQEDRMTKLNAAQDALRLPNGTRKQAIADLVVDAEDALQKHVQASARPGETTAAAHARLMDAGDSQFIKFADLLERARTAHDATP